MTLVKKILDSWQPSEFPHIKIGDTVDFGGNVAQLVKEGSIVLVDEIGKELPPPGTKFTCPICFYATEQVSQFTNHVITAHQPQAKTAVEKVEDEVKQEVEKAKEWSDEKKKAFGEKMRKAREAKKSA